MGIYIKGMEMPKVCYECKMLDDHYDYPCCIITGEQRGYNFRTRERRMDNCPLTEVPEPHGRLADADALYKELVKESDYHINEMENQEKNPNEYVDNFRVYTSYILSGLTSAMISLHNAPTVIEGSE